MRSKQLGQSQIINSKAGRPSLSNDKQSSKQMFHQHPLFYTCLASVFLIILISISGCSSSGQQMESSDRATYDAPAASDDSYSGKEMVVSEEEGSDVAYDGETNTGHDRATHSNFTMAGSGAEAIERRIIREQSLTQQVQDLPTVLKKIEVSVAKTPGAYIESLEEWKSEYQQRTDHHAFIVLRIPVEESSDLITEIESYGNVLNRQVSGRDVTDEYVDNESRLRNLNTHEERLLTLYDKATSIEDMLKIEKELSRIREQIEAIQGRQMYLNEVTSTMKLAIELIQVEDKDFAAQSKDQSMWEEAWAGFRQSLQSLQNGSERFIVSIITSLPYLIILGIITVLFFLIFRKMTAINKAKHEALKQKILSREKESLTDHPDDADHVNHKENTARIDHNKKNNGSDNQ